MPKIFGHIDGIEVGAVFDDRVALREAKVHIQTRRGISGDKNEGADSIVLSGGYVDDKDYGDQIIYTGDGGNDPATKRQIADQEMVGGNLWLTISCNEGRPVRVVRGAKHKSPYSPKFGYSYDGLYYVDRYWSDSGQDGFLIWRFDLRQHPDSGTGSQNNELIELLPTQEEGDEPAPRALTTIQRVVRNTAVGARVKGLHRYTCQICGTKIKTRDGVYAEAAHIRPLGGPHNGPDVASNILCLCPNCHVEFDRLALYVEADNSVWSTTSGDQIGELRMTANHSINAVHLEYHKGLCRPDEDQ